MFFRAISFALTLSRAHALLHSLPFSSSLFLLSSPFNSTFCLLITTMIINLIDSVPVFFIHNARIIFLSAHLSYFPLINFLFAYSMLNIQFLFLLYVVINYVFNPLKQYFSFRFIYLHAQLFVVYSITNKLCVNNTIKI